MKATKTLMFPLLITLAACGYSDEAFYGNTWDEGAPVERANDHEDHGLNPWVETSEEATSSFSMDVNTASYTMARRAILEDGLPVAESVRTEEFLNYFRFEYPQPTDSTFAINMEVAPSYFGSTAEEQKHLLRIGVRGKSIPLDEMRPANIVLLIDVSGSMASADRLGLVQESINGLLENLRPTDTIAIQTYASGSTTVLEPTAVAERGTIQAAVDNLQAGGGTNGEGGIVAAYDLADKGYLEEGINRVMIFTDGDFNIGKTGDDLVELVKSYRDRQIFLSTVGFGNGGYGDRTMEQLARYAQGTYFYIDSSPEAQRIFGTELPSTLEVIAQDARIQVEFSEDAVLRYRLIGYEKRVMSNEDFDKEETDAAEIGPDHTVTALYEMVLNPEADTSSLLSTVRIRHREGFDEATILTETFIKRSQVLKSFDEASKATRFAASVVHFAEILRSVSRDLRFDEIVEIADAARYTDNDDQEEFVDLVRKVKSRYND